MIFKTNNHTGKASTLRCMREMRVKHSSLFALPFSLALLGCETSLSTLRDVPLGHHDTMTATIGVPYTLPMTQFDITLTRSVSGCAKKDESSGNIVPKISVSMEAKAEPQTIAGETYIIDYLSLSNSMKTSSLTINYYEDIGTLKSINALVTDNTAEILTNIAGTAAGIARIAAGIPTAAPAVAGTSGPDQYVAITCSQQTKNNLKNVKTNTKLLENRNNALKAATESLDAKLKELKSIIAANALTDGQRKSLERLQNTQSIALASQQEVKVALEKVQKDLSITRSFKWPTDFTSRQNKEGSEFELNEKDLAKWAKLLIVDPLYTHPNRSDHFCSDPSIWTDKKHSNSDGIVKTRKTPNFAECLRSTLDMSAALVPSVLTSQSTSAVSTTNVTDDKPTKGFIYRTPGRGKIKICRNTIANDCSNTPPKDAVSISSQPITITQLGQLRLLPFTNKAFEDAELSVTLAKDGRLEKFEYKDKAASAKGASGLANNTVGEISSLIAAIEADKLTKAEKALADEKAKREAEAAAITNQRAEDLALVQHEVNILTQTLERDRLLNPVVTLDLDATNASAALLEARLRELNAILAQLQTQATINDFLTDK